MKRVRDRHPNDGEWDTCCEDCGATIPEGYTEEAATRDWNTRPAPAATDTGLVTVAWMIYKPGGTPLTTPIKENAKGFNSADELVTRSQAEELLAAEREGKRFWQNEYTQKSKLLLKAEADKAAKDARIAELEDGIQHASVWLALSFPNAAGKLIADLDALLRAKEASHGE